MKTGLVDLHVHTTASDGTMTPQEVVALAARSGLQAIAITDHDTVDGVMGALQAGRELGLEVIPGVEISADFPGEMHILGYFVDPGSAKLQDGLARLRSYRDQRNPLMVQKLRDLGFDITLEEVVRAADGGVIGRPHFASVLVQKGYVRDFVQAFEKYLGAGKPAYVKKDRLTPRESLALISAAGGIPVLAHPKYLEVKDNHALEELVKDLALSGLAGIEAYYTSYTPEETRKYHAMAARNGLLVTGGSDFHGANKPDIRIGRGQGDLQVRYEVLANLKGLLKIKK